MKQAELKQLGVQYLEEVFHGSDVILRFTFKTSKIRGNCAHLAVLFRNLAHGFSFLRDKSAHLWENDCFECLSPHKIYGSAKTYTDDEPITRMLQRGIGNRGGKCFHTYV
ncbi:MAG: hypothetical protein FWE42_04540 [Defluviitaleaceae bacterium]|nr:hypothetical protein [Defluviitaleaceae bacterium]